MDGSLMFSSHEESKEIPFFTVIILSLLFHIIIFIGIPLMARILSKPQVYKSGTKTFQLVIPPGPRAQVQESRVVKKEKSPVVKDKKEKRFVPKNEKSDKKSIRDEAIEDLEDATDLNELLNDLPVAVSNISVGSSFRYNWYLENIKAKVERNWRPPVNDKNLSVVLTFTIYNNGAISEVIVKTSSGNSMLDNMAVAAVKGAAPFSKFPPGFNADKLEPEYTLRATRE